MEQFLNKSDLNKSFINFENTSSNDIFSRLNSEYSFINKNSTSKLFISKDSKESFESSDESTSDKDSIKSSKSYKTIKFLSSSVKFSKSKFNINKNNSYRKDIYGNEIKKGGKQKVSFKDDIKGKLLVEMTLIDVKQNSIRGKNYKKYTINMMARDKKESNVCIIF